MLENTYFLRNTNALALASDDLVVAIYKSDFDELSYFDRREIEKEKIYGSAKIGETQIISTQKAKKTTESYSASETLKGWTIHDRHFVHSILQHKAETIISFRNE